MHLYKDYIKKSKEIPTTAASNSSLNLRPDTKTKTKNQTRKYKWKENKCIEISIDKLSILHTRKCVLSYTRKTSREKLNLF